MERKEIVIEKIDGTKQKLEAHWDPSVIDNYKLNHNYDVARSCNEEIINIIFDLIKNNLVADSIQFSDIKSIHFLKGIK